MFNGKIKVLMLKGDKGDAGTSGDYTGLTHKPQINGVTLEGNKTPSDLGLMTQTEAEELQGDMSNLGTRVTNLGYALTNLQQDVESYYATMEYVDNAIDSAITQAINADY